jgi:SAM-dependent methyltransferase
MSSGITASSLLQIETWFSSDAQFHHLYPVAIQQLAQKHWTPLIIAQKASGFLAAEDNARILDIGSGAGKFCLAAAFFKPNAHYYGIEQRKTLIAHAELARKILKFRNVSFIHGNFTGLDFRSYDHFYFYNSFYENLAFTDKIDHSITQSVEMYNYYTRHLYQQLQPARAGTKLVTFNSLGSEVPPGFKLVKEETDILLRFWIKE